jgi:hypothetical protein
VAAYTSTQTGNWSSTSTWGGSGPPGDGDTAVISSGHTVTVDAATTVGKGDALTAPQASSDNASVSTSAGGGSLPNGNYYGLYTNCTSGGLESGPSGEFNITVSTAETVTVTLPALPAGVDSRNIYLSNTSGGSYTGRLYKTGVTGTSTTLTSASWTDGTTTYANAVPPPLAVIVFGNLTVGTGIALTVKGDVAMVNAPINQNAGSDFIINVPASTIYRVLTGTDSGQASALWTISGSSGSRCGVSRTGSGTANIQPAGRAHSGGTMVNGNGGVVWNYCDVDDLGSSSVNAFLHNDLGSGRSWEMYHVVWDGCGKILLEGNGNGTSRIVMDHMTVRNTTDTLYGVSWEGTVTVTTGERRVEFCVFHCPLRYSKGGFEWNDNIMNCSNRNEQGARSVSFDRNLVLFYVEGGQELVIEEDFSDNWFLGFDGTSDAFNNWHALSNPSPPDRIYSDGNVWESPYTTGGGDLHYTVADITVTNNLLLPDLSGTYEAGDLVNVSSNGTDTNTYVVEHNTCFANTQGVLTSEGGARTGNVTSYKSNIGWGPAGTGGFHLGEFTPEATDKIAAADCTHNGTWRLSAGQEGGGYDWPITGTPGANDVQADPEFVDPTRNIMTWGRSLGLTGTDLQVINGVLTELCKLNDADWDSNFSVANYLTYIRAGFAPTNAAYQNAGHDGVTIGAVEYVAAGTTVTPDAASLTLTTFAPTVTATDPKTVTPDVLALDLTTYAPTVTVGIPNTVTPDTLSLTLTTFAPDVGFSGSATPSTAAITLTTYRPAVRNSGDTIASGSMTLLGV